MPHRDKLYRYSLWMNQQAPDSEDILQECFIKLWKMRNELNKYASIEFLAMRIIKNLVIDNHRKKTADIAHDFGMMPQPDAEAQWISKEETDHLRKVMHDLDEPYSTVLYLRSIEEMEIRDIAQQLNMNHNTVEVVLSRARKKVREKLKSEKI
jgi:RNA polymerase sigma-70 factor (ECF subfamily)